MLIHPDSINLLKNSRKRFNSVDLIGEDEDDVDQEHIKLLKLVGKDIKILQIGG